MRMYGCRGYRSYGHVLGHVSAERESAAAWKHRQVDNSLLRFFVGQSLFELLELVVGNLFLLIENLHNRDQ